MKIIEKIKRKFGWIDCPMCGEFIKPVFVKDWIYHPEEPSLFAHYYCPSCSASTPIMASGLVQDAAKRLGYENFEDYVKHVTKE